MNKIIMRNLKFIFFIELSLNYLYKKMFFLIKNRLLSKATLKIKLRQCLNMQHVFEGKNNKCDKIM